VRFFASSGINLIATIFITRRLLRRVLLSSDSANRPKVVLLIAIKDQARALHYLKAHPLVKSKLKSRPSVRRSPLLRPFEMCAFSIAAASIYSQQSASPCDSEVHVIIKQK